MTRFNEAGALLPRKLWPLNKFNPVIPHGFNEAGALLPRK